MEVWLADEECWSSIDDTFKAVTGEIVSVDDNRVAEVLEEMNAFGEDPEFSLVWKADIQTYVTTAAMLGDCQDELIARLQAADYAETLTRKYRLSENDVWSWYLADLWNQKPDEYIRYIDERLSEPIRRLGITDDDVSHL